MPIIHRSSYPGPPRYQFNGHAQTIVPNLMRRVKAPYRRERLELPDGDFLDLDWIRAGNERLILLSHGLEGSSTRPYVAGAARMFAGRGWDVLAWNCRSCSGEMNRLPRLYHHGDIDDLGTVVDHALHLGKYERIVMAGFSMGGSMTLKYLGVKGEDLHPSISGGIAFSTPCELESCVGTLEKRSNRIYRNRFFQSLRRKIEIKGDELPAGVDLERLEHIRTWREFDEYFSAPLNGYGSAREFYENSSANRFLKGTAVPTLVVNAGNDPILSRDCTPFRIADRHPLVFVEKPRSGGHVGFSLPADSHAWSEYRALEFAESCL